MTKGPITSGFPESSIMIVMIGTAMTPFTIAAQTSAFMESIPDRTISTPSTVATVRTA